MHVFIVGRGFRFRFVSFRFVSFPVPAFITCRTRVSLQLDQTGLAPRDYVRHGWMDLATAHASALDNRCHDTEV